ncbi:MAG: hypothetical protein AAGC44_08920 [Planctomycetota bacterium]
MIADGSDLAAEGDHATATRTHGRSVGKVKDHLPGKAGDPGRTAADNRLFVNAVLYVLKTGTP